MEPAQVQERVENHLKSLLIKHFDPQKADSIFTVEGEVRSLKTPPAVQIHNVQKHVKGVLSVFKYPHFAFLDSCLAGADDRTHHMERPFL